VNKPQSKKTIRVPGGMVKISKYFTAFEMRCRCGRVDCNAKPMRQEFLDKLDKMREYFGRALKPTSAARCEFWNRKVGGAENSQHLRSNACDFYFLKEKDLEDAKEAAIKADLGGIGFGKLKLHVDDRGHVARWKYDD
jgi:uncharacterized protein YcbK (DUF882 family)